MQMRYWFRRWRQSKYSNFHFISFHFIVLQTKMNFWNENRNFNDKNKTKQGYYTGLDNIPKGRIPPILITEITINPQRDDINCGSMIINHLQLKGHQKIKLQDHWQQFHGYRISFRKASRSDCAFSCFEWFQKKTKKIKVRQRRWLLVSLLFFLCKI